MTVIIGVDPLKQSHTAVAICSEEREVAMVTVRATSQQTTKLLAWAEPFEQRTWAIESTGGLGYLLAQQFVAPIEHSSGGRIAHRLSRRGNRKHNNAIHSAALTQIRDPGTDGRIYFERKVPEGKTKRAALRSLKRQVSNALFRQLVLDAERAREDTRNASWPGVVGSAS
jgi:transposase